MGRTQNEQRLTGSNLVWMLDDEMPSHNTERAMLSEQGCDFVVTRSASYKTDYAKYATLAKGILLQCSFPLGAEDIRGLTACKIITVTCGGYNNLDVAAATEQGIIATYVPGYCIEEVSDHVLALMLALNRHLVDFQSMVRDGSWHAIDFNFISRLNNQVLGIVGMGRIGQAVARKAKCLGLQVKVYDPYISESQVRGLGMEPVTFDELIASADFVSLHVLLTKDTYHMVNAQTFANMKDTAYLINTCRGDVVDETALVNALRTKQIAGAGLDVLSKEPPDLDNPLLSMPNVIVTPHSAYISHEAMAELRERAIRAITDAIKGEVPQDVINPEVLKRI